MGQRLLDVVRERARRLGLARRTEKAYVGWIPRFVLANDPRHPRLLGAPEVEAFLTRLGVDGGVAASTQHQALAALLFLYREVLGVTLPWMDAIARARRPKRLPVVLSRDEVAALRAELEGVCWLGASLLYGSGLRLLECLRLRVQDVDFTRAEITVRTDKGGKDRRTMLPLALHEPPRAQLGAARHVHERDLAAGHGAVSLPAALARKYASAAREWRWQYVFPASKRDIDRDDGAVRRHHLHDLRETVLQRTMRRAVLRARIHKRATCHTLRHSSLTPLREAGYDIRTVQELPGHADVATTQIYTHVLNRGPGAVRSPLDI